ncbi:efflux RND transporter periplasmic adaptor subunit [Jannaschia seohaensis]|uniref:Membrane fusion protein, multidrug efflux system n=1 Tax=Jannaschia seohaensis TaxID=475081 RepID=A0A2Y9B1C5_9RHOB|nr:efflux RND transporter periplasmic adaptor subunit [Jannaschia seohaensis]PWJ16490.1 multidrug efflux system membrane fusion protein [Jannaschia seohaensis]SSA48727.1 membrane fusion protein, multidrug efflux system [Jannaschia seohaensis]
MTEDTRKELTFESDPGAGRATWVAAFIALAVVVWMGSGFFLPSAPPSTPEAAPAAGPVSVATERRQAEAVTLRLQAEGQAEPDRDTRLRAEVSGDVAEVLVEKGADVAAGQVLARLDTDRAEADLRRAEEELARAEREFDNAESLLERGVATADRVAEARADLAAAQAAVTAARDAREASDITAPFAGRIEEFGLDPGEFVQAGAEIGRIVDLDPLTVAIQVPQQAVAALRVDQTADVVFITGMRAAGRVTFVGTAAAAETRTFLVEIEVPNPDGAIPAGISATVVIPTGQALGQFVQPSTISLDPDGRIGVKVVEAGRVVFYPVEVVRAETGGIWVTGLPEEVEIITVGQGFVQAGEAVETRQAETPE